MKTLRNSVSEKYYVILCILTAIYLMMAAGYYEICGATVSVALFCLFIWYSTKSKVFFFVNDTFCSLAVISVSYLISCIWAVDSSSAIWGIAKFFPILMYTLCVMQLSVDYRHKLLLNIPHIAVVIVGLSLLLQFIPTMKNQIVINGRLGGLFGYPNTFAIFLLISLWISLSIESKYILFIQGIITVGLVLTGSRSVFAIAAVVLIGKLRLSRNEKQKICKLFLIIIVSIILALMLDKIIDLSVVNHVTDTVSVTGTSTFWGRILYYKDALPIILKNPFGLGYLGYYFMQGSFQNGVYSVRWIHNDILQLLLDIGWIPAILFIIAVVRSFFSKNINSIQKGVIAILLVHGLFDFNMEFVAMWFILILCLDLTEGKQKQFVSNKTSKAILLIIGTGLSVFILYIGIVSSAVYLKKFDFASKISPGNIFVEMNELIKADNAEDMDKYADKILSHNQYISLAWSAKAKVAYNQGDFENVFIYKEKAIECNRYDIDEYIDYFDMLNKGYSAYIMAGDIYSAEVCYEKAVSIQEKLEALEATTDNMAWKLYNTPKLEMPEEYKQFILQGGAK